MKIRIRVAGFLGNRPLHLEGLVELEQGLSFKKILKPADRSPAFKNYPCLQEIFRQKIQPTVLINGDSLPLPEGLNYRLADGDEITIVTALAGG
ncbi:MAG: MoaD/ThiS family protein [Deltaproteobacteria bacterium]|nr:MoaD/ThiS family protein [Deltaproteobacteria bacterium]